MSSSKPSTLAIPGALILMSAGGRDLTERHREVLREAMALIAERGYRGASLRELARRVGMQQPSLYHYFRSKDELVQQILTTFGVGGVGNLPQELPFPEDIEGIPAAIAAMVAYLYDYTEWPVFVRFLFNLSFEAPQYAPQLRGMFTDTTEQMFRMAAQPYVASGRISENDCVNLCRMVVNAVGLCFIEERLLFPREEKNPWMEQYIAFVVRFTSQALALGASMPSLHADSLRADSVTADSVPADSFPGDSAAPPPAPTPPTGRKTPERGRQRGR